MRVAGRVRLNLLLLFAVLAAPLAWTAQIVVGYGIGDAGCSVAGMRWGVDERSATAALFGATGAIALAGLAVALWLERTAPRNARGRIAFLATGGILISVVFLVLIVLSGVAALALEECRPA
jgi:hypothetical protein